MTRVCLLRGVNVSGANRLPMTEFRQMLEGLGFGAVQSYIQSGNALFDSDLPQADVEAMIGRAIAARFGFEVPALVLDAGEIAAALRDHPFAGAAANRVHVVFLAAAPHRLDEAGLRALALPGDGWHLAGNRFTLHTPAGFGTSKLAEKLAKFLPAPMTARNLRTVAALQAMIEARA